MKKTDSCIHWIGYSWYLGPSVSHLCITHTSNVVDFEYYPLSWASNLRASAHPSPGIEDTMGLSGIGGYLFQSQSKLGHIEKEWLRQVQHLEENFERLLADILQGILSTIVDSCDGSSSTFIAIQGPAFPKLIGRLSYRHLCRNKPNLSIMFVTFRRRFLTPSPLLNDELMSEKFPGILHGPLPSSHEESLTKRYYVLPNYPNTHLKRSHFSPLMIEHLQDDKSPDDNLYALADFLRLIGIVANTDGVSTNNPDLEQWAIYPNMSAFQKVIVPRPLLVSHRKSSRRLQELLGEQVSDVDPVVLAERLTSVALAQGESIFFDIAARGNPKVSRPKLSEYLTLALQSINDNG